MNQPPETSVERIVALVGVIVFAAFLYSLREILTPFVGFVALAVFYFTMRQRPAAKPIFVVGMTLMAIWVYHKLAGVLGPFFFSIAMAYLLNPLVSWLEKRRLKRTPASLLVLLVFMLALATLGIFLVPQMIQEIGDLIDQTVTALPQLKAWIQKTIVTLLARFPIDIEKLEKALLEDLPGKLQTVLGAVLRGALNFTATTSAVLGQLLNVILIPVLTFYFLKDGEKLWQQFALRLFPENRRAAIQSKVQIADALMSGFLRGQLTVMAIVGILTGIAMSLAGVPYALFVGLMTGLLNIIPYLGLLISLILTLVVALFTANPVATMIKAAIVFAIVQGVEGSVISPKIVGDKVGLHPMIVILSVLVGAQFFGFWGLLLAVPVAAIINAFVNQPKTPEPALPVETPT
ncbi:MAG: AI-2E family transporter [candidate division KSB1 bacterium]|nr:AI-2E family transporter [candidate division KSB1 bacterium]MDZ7365755.1 AI-2E family transporter [candidate division KSB1 bacterium]MDZ7403765.1 AI-2E family transporter [candidate division KSB1 bacterium]